MDPERKMNILSMLSLVSLVLSAGFIIYVWISEGFSFFNVKTIVAVIILLAVNIPLFKLHGQAFDEYVSD